GRFCATAGSMPTTGLHKGFWIEDARPEAARKDHDSPFGLERQMSALKKKTLSLATTPTPSSLGYRMPAEWEEHASTWIGWPKNRTDWPGKFEAIPWVYADIVRYLALEEDVNIIVGDAKIRSSARDVLRRSHADLKRVKFHLWPAN